MKGNLGDSETDLGDSLQRVLNDIHKETGGAGDGPTSDTDSANASPEAIAAAEESLMTITGMRQSVNRGLVLFCPAVRFAS